MLRVPVNKILLTNGKKGPLIPIPTHFFKIIIGRMDGKLAAVGFLVPHLSDLKQDDYKRYAVPISKIETATHLKFMPPAALPADKNVVDHRWLDLLPALIQNTAPVSRCLAPSAVISGSSSQLFSTPCRT